MHPVTLKQGLLRSEVTINNALIDDEFIAGFTGVQTFVEVFLNSSKPKIVGGSCVRTSTGTCLLSWAVSGPAKKIDHFVITAAQLGMTAILGKSHSFSHNNTYSFEDARLSLLSGDVEYFVTPVFTDFTTGERSKIGTLASHV